MFKDCNPPTSTKFPSSLPSVGDGGGLSPSSLGASPRLLFPGSRMGGGGGGVSLHPGGLDRGARRRPHHHHRRRFHPKKSSAGYSSDSGKAHLHDLTFNRIKTMNSGPRSEHDRRAPFRRSAANDAPPSRGFVNESADVWEEEEERSRAQDVEVRRLESTNAISCVL